MKLAFDVVRHLIAAAISVALVLMAGLFFLYLGSS